MTVLPPTALVGKGTDAQRLSWNLQGGLLPLNEEDLQTVARVWFELQHYPESRVTAVEVESLTGIFESKRLSSLS